MRNANKLTLILWMLFPLLSTAQVTPPITRSVLTTNIPAFGSAGQALFRISVPPYLNWSNVVASGGLSISDSNNIINLASNYTYAVSNYAYTASNSLAGQIVTASNAVLNASSNYTFAVSNLVVASTNGTFIEKLSGTGTNLTLKQVGQTGPALTIGTNAGSVFSIMGVTNGPSPYLVQVGSPMLAANSGGTNMLLGGTNGNWKMRGSLDIGSTPLILDGGGLAYSTGNQLGISGTGINLRTSGNSFIAIDTDSNSFNATFQVTHDMNGSTWPVFTVVEDGTLGVSTNTPNAVLHLRGSPTNQYLFQADASNNLACATLDTNGVLTVKSNLILSSVRWVDSPVQLFWAATGPTAPSAIPVVPGSQILGSGFSVGGIGTEKVYGSFQVNHNVCASNATVYTEHHLHVSPTNAPSAGSSNIAFTIVYDWANVGGTRFGPYTNTVQIGLTAQTYNNLIEFGHQTNFFPTISAISRCTIYRSAATSNEFNATVILDGVDVHYPIDRLGSASDTAP